MRAKKKLRSEPRGSRVAKPFTTWYLLVLKYVDVCSIIVVPTL